MTTKVEKEKYKLEMLNLFFKGAKKRDIEAHIKNNYHLSTTTFNRYWKTLMDVEYNELKERVKQEIVGGIGRNMERISEANFRYNQTKERRWLDAAHRFDNDYFDLLQKTGIIEKVPDRLEVKGTLGTIEEINKRYEEYIKDTKKELKDK